MEIVLTDPPPATHGFSLVELVMVMVILGILAAVAIPRFFDRITFDTVGFYDQAQGIVRFAQKVAVAQRTSVRVDVSAGAVQACYCATPACAACGAAVLDPLTGNALSATAPAGVALAPVADFSFNGLGRSSLASALAVTVTGDAVKTFYVEPETGYVHP